MFERFTHDARAVVVRTQEEARQLRHDRIGTEHLLLGLLAEAPGVLAATGITAAAVREGIAAARGPSDADALATLGIDLDEVRRRVEATFGTGALSAVRRGGRSGHLPFSPRAKTVLELSLREAIRLKHNWIGPEHILLGLIREGRGLAAAVLVALGVDLERLRDSVVADLGRRAS